MIILIFCKLKSIHTCMTCIPAYSIGLVFYLFFYHHHQRYIIILIWSLPSSPISSPLPNWKTIFTKMNISSEKIHIFAHRHSHHDHHFVKMIAVMLRTKKTRQFYTLCRSWDFLVSSSHQPHHFYQSRILRSSWPSSSHQATPQKNTSKSQYVIIFH